MDREFLERIDRHMARGNELMSEVREEIQLSRLSYEHQLDLTRTVIVRSEERFERSMRRSDQVIEGNQRALESFQKVLERQERVSAAVIDALNELRAEVRAQTQAIFRLIDRIDGLNGPSPA